MTHFQINEPAKIQRYTDNNDLNCQALFFKDIYFEVFLSYDVTNPLLMQCIIFIPLKGNILNCFKNELKSDIILYICRIRVDKPATMLKFD